MYVWKYIPTAMLLQVKLWLNQVTDKNQSKFQSCIHEYFNVIRVTSKDK